jgi:hypothetical protein
MQIQKIILTDETLEDSELTMFIAQCIGQIGGIQGVVGNLHRESLGVEAEQCYEVLINALNDKNEILRLSITSVALTKICRNIVNTLEDYKDLHAVMGINHSEAIKLIEKI